MRPLRDLRFERILLLLFFVDDLLLGSVSLQVLILSYSISVEILPLVLEILVLLSMLIGEGLLVFIIRGLRMEWSQFSQLGSMLLL